MPLTLSDIISKAREITGSKETRSVAERYAPEAAVQQAMREKIRQINKAYGTTAGVKEVTFEATDGVQDYSIATNVGNDVYQVDVVLRSGAYVPDGLLGDDDVDFVTGRRTGDAVIPPGLQRETLDQVTQFRRARRADEFDFEVIGDTLRLLGPLPTGGERVYVRYVTNAAGVETIPADAEDALVHAACVAIFDCLLNRLMSDPASTDETSQARIGVLERQRARYEGMYEAARAALA